MYGSNPPSFPKTTKTAAERAIDLVAIFADLTDQECRMLATKTKPRHHDEGEVLVEPGTVLRSLFVVGLGLVSLTAVAPEGEIGVAPRRSGRSFRRDRHADQHPAEASLKALVPVTTYELAKQDLAPILEARPEVSHELCRALAKRPAARQLIAAAGISKSAPREG